MSSGAEEQYLVGAAEAARVARDGARAGAGSVSEPGVIRRGQIAAVSGSGQTYTVSLIGSDEAGISAIVGCRAWGGVGFEVGDRVWLVWQSGRPVPWVLGGGGSFGGSGVYIVFGGLGFAS